MLNHSGFCQSITLNESDPEVLKVTNQVYYELGIVKSNGDIAYIKDLQTDQILAPGDPKTGDWTLDYKNEGFYSTADFLNNPQNQFTYSWDEAAATLSLQYRPGDDVVHEIGLTLSITFTTLNYFDMQLAVENNRNDTIIRVDFPDNLALKMTENDSAVLPSRYPGMLLFPEFFNQDLIVYESYPDYMHADYVSIIKGESNLSIYSLNSDTRTLRTGFGFFPNSGNDNEVNYHFRHEYTNWLIPGASWLSPVSRFRIGESTIETLKAYRVDNKIDQFPSLREKLGDEFDNYAQSPMHFYHFHAVDETISYKQVPALVNGVTIPAIVMFTNFTSGGYFGYSPDFYPPNPDLGSPADFAEMVREIESSGLKTSAATIPGWWHKDSPTMRNMSTESIKAVSALDMNAQPYFYTWTNGEILDPGYFVSPNSQIVQEKSAFIIDKLTTEFGIDIMYHDVLGTHNIGYDFNAAASDPLDYIPGWYRFLENDKANQHIVEYAYDKMAKYAIGSMGINRWDNLDVLNYWHHEPNKPIWNPYPCAPVILNDIMANYHWGSNPGYENTSYYLQFAVPMGIYIGVGEYGAPGGYWDRLTRDFSTHVMSRLWGKQLVDYTGVPGEFTIADYGDIEVTKNWNFTDTLYFENYSLPPSGVLVESKDGSLVAGIFCGFNGEDLSGYKAWEDHYIIQLTDEYAITLKHPYSKDTPIKIKRPTSWINDEGISIKCITQEGTEGSVEAEIEARAIRFDLNERYQGELADEYIIEYDPDAGSETLPEFMMYQNAPNPFIYETTIDFVVTKENLISIEIRNLQGQLVRLLLDQHVPVGSHSLTWDGKSEDGSSVPPGIYFCRMRSEGNSIAKKLVKLR